MNRKIRIAPSILAADFLHLADEVKRCESANADLLHCDVMDGHFVPNLTFGPPLIKQMKSVTKLSLDVHLMIEQPELSIELYRLAGASAITIHQEVSPHLHRTLARIRELGALAGVAINPSTPVEILKPVLGSFDILLIMSVHPGFGGQKFISDVVEKIRIANEWRESNKLDFSISVDGGIDSKTAPIVVDAGADTLVAGTSVFKGDVAKNIALLRQSVNA